MTQPSILGAAKLVAFVPTTDPAKARAFYEDVLGLRLVEDAKPFALVFDANGTMLRVTTVHEHHPDPFTVLGWQVESVEDTVADSLRQELSSCAIRASTTAIRMASGPRPAALALHGFTDPDGNVLSVTEF